MSISDRMSLAILFLVGAATGCGAGSDCLRYSDCDPGLTCAYGHCVAPPAQAPGDGASGDDGESGTTGDDSGSIPTQGSGDDANLQGGDAPAE